MTWPPDWLIVAGLFVLRLGVPLALTALIAYGLARLDARWRARELARQAEAQAQAARPARVPCWQIKRCDAQLRARCLAYQRPDVPCWQAFRAANRRVPERCFECEVFLTAG